MILSVPMVYKTQKSVSQDITAQPVPSLLQNTHVQLVHTMVERVSKPTLSVHHARLENTVKLQVYQHQQVTVRQDIIVPRVQQ